MRFSGLVGALCALALLACGEDSTSAGDGGMDAGGDGDGASSSAGDGDGGGDPVWMPRDSGMRGGDAGKPDYSDRTCTVLLDLADPSAPPVCAPETRACIQACDPDMDGCSDACLVADPSAGSMDGLDCEACTVIGLFACLADAGCGAETNAFMCCFEDNCLGGPDNCAETECNAEQVGVFECAVQKGVSCLDAAGAHNDHCFMDADADADAGI